MAFEKQGSFKDDAPPPQPIKKRKSGAELQVHGALPVD